MKLVLWKARSAGAKVEREHKGTFQKIKKDVSKDGKLDTTIDEFTESVASEHEEEDKNYYPRLKALEKLPDLKGIDGKIVALLKKKKGKIKDADVHALAKRLNIDPDKFEKRVYKLLSNLVNGIK